MILDLLKHVSTFPLEGIRRFRQFLFQRAGGFLTVSLFLCIACNNASTNTQAPRTTNFEKIGTVEKLDPALDNIIAPDAKAEIIASGFDWTEGPLWVASHNMLLFSDVPRDTIFKWTEAEGISVYLTPSGYTDTIPRGGEMGSNGLTLDKDGRLVLCQCGNRQMAVMDAPLDRPAPQYISLAANWEGKKFNSPNDLVYNSKGELFFTDPPYGLEKHMNDPKKEIPFQGVFKVGTDGKVQLMVDSLTRPNGIAFLPGEQTVIIANSDPFKPYWYAYDIDASGNFTNGRIFHSAAGNRGEPGLPDGLKVDKNGNVFATGPGGIWIISAEGKLLGKFKVPDSPTSNCAFSEDEKTLYITNDGRILRLRLRD
jgi:gluconolactonase